MAAAIELLLLVSTALGSGKSDFLRSFNSNELSVGEIELSVHETNKSGRQINARSMFPHIFKCPKVACCFISSFIINSCFKWLYLINEWGKNGKQMIQ